ncbi:MAG: lytic transglycosylase domain-containing protein [Pseudomonadales bacterium]|nr:lytic transglycosylase domain-containing protein [Pseudomonadales bacterium]
MNVSRAGTPLVFLATMLSAQASCWQDAARHTQVDVRLLQAIAWVESRNHPDILHRNHDGSLDVGLMQINSRWWPQLPAPSYLLDPCYNLQVGAWILGQAIQRVGPVWAAVGRYHGGNAAEQARYQQKVYRRWQVLVAKH